jgi:hypothetical protein
MKQSEAIIKTTIISVDETFSSEENIEMPSETELALCATRESIADMAECQGELRRAPTRNTKRRTTSRTSVGCRAERILATHPPTILFQLHESMAEKAVGIAPRWPRNSKSSSG